MTAINLTIPHSHTQAVAWQRLLDCLQGQKSDSWFATVTRLSVNIDDERYIIATKLRIAFAFRAVTHTLNWEAMPSYIRVTSDAADEPLEALEMAIEEQQIKAMLTEGMK